MSFKFTIKNGDTDYTFSPPQKVDYVETYDNLALALIEFLDWVNQESHKVTLTFNPNK